jgi:alanine racemase
VNDDAPTDPAAVAVRLHIDLTALAANYAALCARAAPSEVSAVVKANAYGLGVGPVAERLVRAGCRTFFVSSVAEGLELRSLIADARIYVLAGGPAAPDRCLEARLVPVLNTLAEVRAWVTAAGGAAAALQLDTGMTRAGLGPEDVATLAGEPGLLAALGLELVLTHLACADEPDHPLNARQVERFAALAAQLPPAPRSIGNSAGTWIGPACRGDLVRPGIALYGGRPFATGPNPMREVVRLEARILQLRELTEDAAIGYGATTVARGGARIATVGAGYADGYPRSLGNRGFAWVAGQRVPVVGRVSMDLITLDVSGVPRGAVTVGDWIQLYGGGIDLEEVAELAGTVSYELLTRLSVRIPRRYSSQS